MHLPLTLIFFTDLNIRYVLLGTMLLTSSTAVVGAFALLKKKALLGDAIAHAVLPGLCVGFMLTGTKHPLYLAIGAFSTGWLAILLIEAITTRSKLKEDTAIALILAISFGIGTLLLTVIQASGNAAQVGLKNFLLGKAATLVHDDLIMLGSLGLVVIATVLLFFKEFTLIAFDKAFAHTIGLPVKRLELLLNSLTVLAIVIGIRTVGIVLMAAMLITPAATARFWVGRFLPLLLVAVAISLVAALTGTLLSYTAPAMPTGPWIVLVISLIAYCSFLLAPGKGLIPRKWQQRSKD